MTILKHFVNILMSCRSIISVTIYIQKYEFTNEYSTQSHVTGVVLQLLAELSACEQEELWVPLVELLVIASFNTLVLHAFFNNLLKVTFLFDVSACFKQTVSVCHSSSGPQLHCSHLSRCYI